MVAVAAAGCGTVGAVGDEGETDSDETTPGADEVASDQAALRLKKRSRIKLPKQSPVAPVAPSAVDCTHVGSGTDYQVGPGRAYENLGDVPFESLVAGDTVRVFWREQAYHEKLMIGGVGTQEQPIRICGVAGPEGQLPVIDGQNATTRPTLDFPFNGHQVRGLIVVGHPNAKPYAEQPAHILIEALEIRNASPEMTFTDKAGQVQSYANSAAGIFIQRADDLTIRGCHIHDNNNGIFGGTGGGVDMTERVLVEGNRILQNGSLTDWYHHNTYIEANGVTYQYNYMGEPRAGQYGVLGANIKERSAGVVIRYNWIEDGGHLIDLVDAQEAKADTVAMPSFHETYVYGNVMIRSDMPGGSMIHYGGDSGLFGDYRKGTLHFYQNTLVVKNQGASDWDTVEVFELSTNEEQLQATNNIFYSAVEPTDVRQVVMLGARDGQTAGVASFENNWVGAGWGPVHAGNNTVLAQVSGFDVSMSGADPGFTSAATDAYTLASGAMVSSAGADMATLVPAAQAVTMEYVKHQGGKPRPVLAAPSLGAMTQ